MMGQRTWRRLLRDESGASSIEYAVLASMIAAVCILIITLLGQQTKDLFARVLEFWK